MSVRWERIGGRLSDYGPTKNFYNISNNTHGVVIHDWVSFKLHTAVTSIKVASDENNLHSVRRDRGI